MAIGLRQYVEGSPQFSVGVSRLRKYEYSMFVEGGDDEAFYMRWLEVARIGTAPHIGTATADKTADKTAPRIGTAPRLSIRPLLHKREVIEKFLADCDPQQVEAMKDFMCFCVDVDYDAMTNAKVYGEPLYYQMWDRERNVRFNDLECFLVSTDAFLEFLESKGYAPEAAREMRQRILEMCFVIGAFRVGNIEACKAMASAGVPMNSPLCIGSRGNAEKLDVFFAFRNGCLDLESLHLEFDDLASEVRGVFGTGEKAGVVEGVVERAAAFCEVGVANLTDFCRGHDIMEVLALKLAYDGSIADFFGMRETDKKLQSAGEALFGELLQYVDFDAACGFPVAQVIGRLV